jgi:F-type H+-transporting ATPase subunit delta
MRPHRSAAKPYARALHELAKERGQAEAVARELGETVEALVREPALREFLARPWASATAKAGVAQEVAGRLGVGRLTRDFVGLVARQGRADHLEAILEVYRERLDSDVGRVRARVRSAVPLTAGEREQLQQRLGQALGGKQVLLEETVDDRLLGGFVAEVDSYIVDGSLNGQLARLRDRLARG